jgi:hypothetical protein
VNSRADAWKIPSSKPEIQRATAILQVARLIQIVDQMDGSVLPSQALHLIGSRSVREIVGIAPLFGVLGFRRPVDFLSAIFHPS